MKVGFMVVLRALRWNQLGSRIFACHWGLGRVRAKIRMDRLGKSISLGLYESIQIFSLHWRPFHHGSIALAFRQARGRGVDPDVALGTWFHGDCSARKSDIIYSHFGMKSGGE